MSEKGEVKVDFTGIISENTMLCEIKDGLELIIVREIASAIILSDNPEYKALREKFAIMIEIIPEDMTVYENVVNIKFEDKHKYYERMQARYGRV